MSVGAVMRRNLVHVCQFVDLWCHCALTATSCHISQSSETLCVLLVCINKLPWVAATTTQRSVSHPCDMADVIMPEHTDWRQVHHHDKHLHSHTNLVPLEWTFPIPQLISESPSTPEGMLITHLPSWHSLKLKRFILQLFLDSPPFNYYFGSEHL